MKITIICLEEHEPTIRHNHGNDIEILTKTKYYDTPSYFTPYDIERITGSDLIIGANNSEELEYLSQFAKPIVSISATTDKSYDFNVYHMEYSDSINFDIVFNRLFNMNKEYDESYFYNNVLLVIDKKNVIYGKNLKRLFLERIRRYLVKQRTDGTRAVHIGQEELESYVMEVDENNVSEKMSSVTKKIVIFTAYNYMNLLFLKDNIIDDEEQDTNNKEEGIIICIDTGFTDVINTTYYENDNNVYTIYNTSFCNNLNMLKNIDTNSIFSSFQSFFKVYLQYVLDSLYDIDNESEIVGKLNMVQKSKTNNYYLIDSQIIISIFRKNCYGISFFNNFDIIGYSEVILDGTIYNLNICKTQYIPSQFQNCDYSIWIGPYNIYVIINNIEDEIIELPFYGMLVNLENENKVMSVRSKNIMF